MKEEMNAREFAHAFNRMCDESKCSECPFFAINCDIAVTQKENIDKIVEVVTKWAEEHPEIPETKKELPDEAIVKLKSWDEVLAWGSEHLGEKRYDIVYGIFKTTYERDLYNKELRVKKERDPDPKGFAVYRLMRSPYLFIPEGFIGEIVEPSETKEEKPQPPVYPKHCIVKLVPYEEALRKEKETALPGDCVYGREPWGMRKDSYDCIQATPVELKFHKHRNMLDGEHALYKQVGGREFYIPDIFIAEVVQDLDEEG